MTDNSITPRGGRPMGYGTCTRAAIQEPLSKSNGAWRVIFRSLVIMMATAKLISLCGGPRLGLGSSFRAELEHPIRGSGDFRVTFRLAVILTAMARRTSRFGVLQTKVGISC